MANNVGVSISECVTGDIVYLSDRLMGKDMVGRVVSNPYEYRGSNSLDIPNGSYKGEWSGYIVTFNTPYGKYKMDCSAGLRGTAPCTVVVKDGEYTVTRTV